MFEERRQRGRLSAKRNWLERDIRNWSRLWIDVDCHGKGTDAAASCSGKLSDPIQFVDNSHICCKLRALCRRACTTVAPSTICARLLAHACHSCCVGFYSGRSFFAATSVFVLALVLAEILQLYSRLVFAEKGLVLW